MKQFQVFLLATMVLLSGCGLITEEARELYIQKSTVSNDLILSAEKAEREGNEKMAEEVYKKEDELADSCGLLQKAVFNKLREIPNSFLKLFGMFLSLPMCERKIHEVDDEFSDNLPDQTDPTFTEWYD